MPKRITLMTAAEVARLRAPKRYWVEGSRWLDVADHIGEQKILGVPDKCSGVVARCPLGPVPSDWPERSAAFGT